MIESTVSGSTEDAANGSKTAGIDVTSAIQSEKVSYMFQYVTTFSATLLLFSSGFALGWSSPALPQLFTDDTPVPMTRDQSAWIVACMEIGVLIAAIPAVWLMDRFGRRRTLLAGIVPIAVSWPLIATANSVTVLCVARLLGGLTFGVGLSVVPVYLGEIAAVRIRGRLTVMVTVTVQLGVLCAYAIGIGVSFATLAWISLAPALLFAGCAGIWLPETPYWLLANGRQTEALHCLRRLHGGGVVECAAEWRALCAANERPPVHGTFGELMHGTGNRRALLIIVGVTVIQVLCGSLTTIAYAETIFADVVRSDELSAGVVSVVFGSVQLVAATVSAAAVDTVGRRPLLLTSVAGTTVCNAVVASWLRLADESTEFDWLPVATIMLGVVFYFVGLATVIFALLAELLPVHLRRVGCAVYALVSGALIFAVNKLFQVVSDGWGRDAAFGAFAVCGVVFAPFVWRMVPETRGRQVEEIRAELEAGGRSVRRVTM